MRPICLFSYVCLLFVSWQSLAQGHKISGRIVDAETLDPLPYAHVFIDQTTLGTVSDINGEYVIENVEDGQYKIVFSFVGYELFSKQVTVEGSDVRISARLVPQLEMLQSVEVKGTKDKEWESQVKKFHRIFFGETEWARDCKITNPWALEFNYDPNDKKTKAVASEPLQIENRALGYTIKCTLQQFAYDKKSYKIKGLYKFEEINTADSREAAQWNRNRKQAYQNSLRFLMRSIIENHENENGFNLYLDNRPEGYIAQTGLFSTELEKNLRPLKALDRLSPAGTPGIYKLTIEKRIEVHHTTQYARQKTYRDVSHPISWIESEDGYILIGRDGYIYNKDHVVTSGELNNFRVAGMLPINYSPGNLVVVNYLTKRNLAKRLQERVFLQCDKATYYPGEKIWFKAHINQYTPSLRDSLSRVLHVELLETDSILFSRKIKIDSLNTSGSILIPENFSSGQYFLRAYTQWMQNYGSSAIEYLPIDILPTNRKKVDDNHINSANSNDFAITNERETADSISYLIQLDSSRYTGTISCAVSVAPAILGLTNQSNLIKSKLTFSEDLPEGTLTEFTFPLEYSFGFKGKVVFPKKKLRHAYVTVLTDKIDSISSLKTNKHGDFEINGLNFYDTMNFSFHARDKKGKTFGKTELLRQPPAPISAIRQMTYSQLTTSLLEHPIQLIKPKSKDTVITIKNKPIEKEQEVTGFADYILLEKDLSKLPQSQSILSVLVGRIPGLKYDGLNRTLSFRDVSSNNQISSDILLVLDGNPMYVSSTAKTISIPQSNPSNVSQSGESNSHQTSPENFSSNQRSNQVTQQVVNPLSQSTSPITDILSNLIVNDISRIEVSRGADPRFGSMSSNGVILIYTKKESDQTERLKSFDLITIVGYSKPERFQITKNFNANTQECYSPTIYWNPKLLVSANRTIQISFPTPKGNEPYRISIGGVTKNGVPVFGELIIEPKKEKSVSASLDLRQK